VPSELAGTHAGHVAGDNLAGAIGLAPSLPPQVGSRLVQSAHSAFASGLDVTAACCAVAFVALAVVAFTTLRHVPPMSNPFENTDPAEAELAEASDPAS
ncbi:MAG: hypothetical protein ABI418_07040, partial [Jatrophihabitantaceae bacterium]